MDADALNPVDVERATETLLEKSQAPELSLQRAKPFTTAFAPSLAEPGEIAPAAFPAKIATFPPAAGAIAHVAGAEVWMTTRRLPELTQIAA